METAFSQKLRVLWKRAFQNAFPYKEGNLSENKK